jgi:hypothetical protein
VSAWPEIVASGLSAALGGAAGAWYQGHAAARARRRAVDEPGPMIRRERFLTGRQGLYEEFFAASSAAFMAVGNYQMASRQCADEPAGEQVTGADRAALDDLGRRAERAVERVRSIAYRVEMRAAPTEVVHALREYVESLNGILDMAWIPAQMHLSEERVRRLMRADLPFDTTAPDTTAPGTTAPDTAASDGSASDAAAGS